MVSVMNRDFGGGIIVQFRRRKITCGPISDFGIGTGRPQGRKVERGERKKKSTEEKGNVSEQFNWSQFEWTRSSALGDSNSIRDRITTDLLRSRRRPRRWDYRASRKSTNAIEMSAWIFTLSARGRMNLTSVDLGNGHSGQWGGRGRWCGGWRWLEVKLGHKERSGVRTFRF